MDFDLHRDDAQLLLIDVQERFSAAIPAIATGGACHRALSILLQGCQLLRVPILISEQVPDKLGPTPSDLRAYAPEAPVLAKSMFSSGDDYAQREALATNERPLVIIAGIEAHICVLATVDDLLRRGYRVVVAVDAIDSRMPANRDHAIATMRQLGAACVPVESILFRLQREAGVGAFREISKLVR
ncbi:MAG: isochorismatase family protein [Planctomycetota bacterium]|jgi:nicotinamidase-related amidase|nr:isochorismatase family protein [Planctomycetota bacterium]